MLELSGIARSTYYYYLKQKDKDKYESEKQEILEIYNAHKGRYGYRRICAELKAKGYTINHKTVLKLMKELHLRGKQSKNGKYHSYKGEVGKVADNLLHIKNVEASFALIRVDNDVAISGRSKGRINVQLILERLKGGGHFDMAGAQVRNAGLTKASSMLKDAIDNYFEFDHKKSENDKKD